MKKIKMLYISPFWPKKTGISEYSEALIWGLKEYYDITLLIDDYFIENREIKHNFSILKKSNLKEIDQYDILLYNFGNNPDAHEYMYDLFLNYPGYIILHDFSLFYLTIGHYEMKNCLYQKIYEIEGVKGIQILKDNLKENKEENLLSHKELAAYLPMNKEIILAAKGVIVHSDYTANKVKEVCTMLNICKIHLVKCEIKRTLKKDKILKKMFQIDSISYIIGAVGFIAPSKQNRLTCLAIKEYNKTHKNKIHYVMIGEGNYVDDLLDDYIHKTGFLENNEFFQAIEECNAIFNLRYPYNGESSATLIQCMDMEKICVVSDIGWFREVPDTCVKKVSTKITIEELVKVIEELKGEQAQQYIRNAKKYVMDYCLPEKIAADLHYFFSKNKVFSDKM